jgi:predicted ribosomally synthesized peptide with nif11-like leader
MSHADAVAFPERVESAETFAKELESARDNPDAVVEKVHAAGFDTSPDEIREAVTDRYGIELTPEQLDQVAAGTDEGLIAAGVGVGIVVGFTAAAAAAV